VANAVSRTATRGVPPDDAVHCAVVAGKGAGGSLAVLAASLLEHTSRPLHLWVLALPGCGPVHQRIAKRHPEIGVTRVPVRGLARELAVDVETATRLLVPELLPRVGRLVLLPLPAVATADIAELADLDLGGHALAAPRRPGTAGVSGHGMIFAAADRLGDRPEAAGELRRAALTRHAFGFDAFTADVLVTDLDRMREDDLGRRALALALAFGLDHVEALHCLLGPDRASVPDRWNIVPTRVPLRGAGLVHWADDVKPWQAALTPERELWRRCATGAPGSAPAAATPTSAPLRRD
jgi:hypothetical protein